MINKWHLPVDFYRIPLWTCDGKTPSSQDIEMVFWNDNNMEDLLRGAQPIDQSPSVENKEGKVTNNKKGLEEGSDEEKCP